MIEAYFRFEAYYRQFFSPDMDEVNSPKNPVCFIRMLRAYVKQYEPLDDFVVKFIEVAGSVELIKGRTIYYRSDAICETPQHEIFTLEHKTASRFGRLWTDQWRQKMQVGVYSHVLYCYFPENKVFGVKINGMIPHEAPELKRDGTAKAGTKDCEFARVPLRKTLDQMEDWYWNACEWICDIECDFEMLAESNDESHVMTAFKKNTENCTKYFGCPYADYCFAWPNPLRHCGEPPIGFKVEHWNPLDLVKESKNIINV
jgi:hypothetical protein